MQSTYIFFPPADHYNSTLTADGMWRIAPVNQINPDYRKHNINSTQWALKNSESNPNAQFKQPLSIQMITHLNELWSQAIQISKGPL